MATQTTVPVTLLKVTTGNWPLPCGMQDTAKSVPRMPATPRGVSISYFEAFEIFFTLPKIVPFASFKDVSESPAPKSIIFCKVIVVSDVILTVELCPLT